MTGLSTLMAQDPDHLTLIKRCKTETPNKPKPNKISLQSFFTYHFINFSVLRQKHTLIHVFWQLHDCRTLSDKTRAKLQSKNGLLFIFRSFEKYYIARSKAGIN